MITRSERVTIEGYLLHRMVFEPSDSVRVSGAALFYHGQGDYAERYVDVLDVFTRRGIRCMITELPGHGLSPGRRGHCGDEAVVDAVVRDMLQEIGDLPYAVMGHSMGGLLALRHLILSGQGDYPAPRFAWLSSPLLRPSARKSGRFRALLQFFAPLMPGLTVSTGVTTQMCRVAASSESLKTPKHQLWHRRVSLSWGATLLRVEKLVDTALKDMSDAVPIIYTQGADDAVCPAETARAFFPRLPTMNKQYHEFEGMLHDPFKGEGRERLFAALESWLEMLENKKTSSGMVLEEV